MRHLVAILSCLSMTSTVAVAQLSTANIQALSANIRCTDHSCEYRPQYVNSAGMDELITQATYEALDGSDWSDGKIKTSPDKDRILFQSSDMTELDKIARSLIRNDKRLIFGDLQNDQIHVKIQAVRVAVDRTNEFGYDLGLNSVDSGTRDNGISVSGQTNIIDWMVSPISSIALNLKINAASKKGYADLADSYERMVTSNENLSVESTQQKSRGEDFDTIREQFGWQVSGKVLADAAGNVRINDLNVTYGIPSDDSVGVSTPSDKTLVERIAFSNQNIQLFPGTAKILSSREVSMKENVKRKSFWIFSRSENQNTRKYRIYFIIEASLVPSSKSKPANSYRTLSVDQINALPAGDQTSDQRYFNSLKAQVVPGSVQDFQGQKVLVGLDRNLLTKNLATKLLSYSVLNLNFNVLLENQQSFQGQMLATNSKSILTMTETEKNCSQPEKCTILRYLLRLGDDPRASLLQSGDLSESYYLMVYSPSAQTVQMQRVSAQDAEKLNKKFVKLHKAGK